MTKWQRSVIDVVYRNWYPPVTLDFSDLERQVADYLDYLGDSTFAAPAMGVAVQSLRQSTLSLYTPPASSG